jgi:hypothetical protein
LSYHWHKSESCQRETDMQLVDFIKHNKQYYNQRLVLDHLDKPPNEIAYVLAKSKCHELSLNGLKTISILDAKELARCMGDRLYLNGLTNLSVGAATELASWKGAFLILDGLKHISPSLAKSLSKWKSGQQLSLNRLNILSTATAESLSKWNGKILFLNGLTRLSVGAAKHLSYWSGEKLYLNGVKDLSVGAANALAKWEGCEIFLNNIKILTTEKAKELSKWAGQTLQLNGVKKLSECEAKALAKWRGIELSLNGIEALSVDAAVALLKWNEKETHSSSHFSNDSYSNLQLESLQIASRNLAMVLAKSSAFSWYFNVYCLDLHLDSFETLDSLPLIIKQDDQGLLHCDDGPAIVLPDGSKCYSIHGVRVKQHIVEKPERITFDEIEIEDNAEVRRIMIERLGWDQYLIQSGGEIIAQDSFGTLIKKEIVDDEPLIMVRVTNSTPESDGKFKKYCLRVPPHMETVSGAIAWTFGMAEAEYIPEIET